MKKITLILVVFGVIILSYICYKDKYQHIAFDKDFNGFNALSDIAHQVNYGPRIYNSYAHDQVISWISSELSLNSWYVHIDSGIYNNHVINNIIGKNSPNPPNIIIGAHYDSRSKADNDPIENNRSLPVPGANDGASGVALLLELSRTINRPDLSIWLVFFDAEDDGNIDHQEWILGSKYFASELKSFPDAVIVVDMVADSKLNIFREINSNVTLTDEIWNDAALLGFSNEFINSGKYAMLDDHIPFLELGIPSALVIDFDYDYWHTTADTLDKISLSSISIVGKTINYWLNYYSPGN